MVLAKLMHAKSHKRKIEMDSSKRIMKVFLHPGDEYLGSLEPQSLQVLTYLKLARVVPYACTIEEACYSSMTLCVSCTPILEHYLTLATTYTVKRPLDIITYLQRNHFDTDKHFTQKQHSQRVALDALLSDKLQPAILYLRWMDNDNYMSITRISYSHLLSFPFSIFYLSTTHRFVERLIMRGAASGITLQEKGAEILARAEKCISLISAKLGKSNYFCGDLPSSHDALVFGYLEIIIQLPFSSKCSLHEKLLSHQNLVDFCQRMRRMLFLKMKERASKRISSYGQEGCSDASWKHSAALWLFVGTGLVALALQGFRVGLFSRFI